MKNKGKAAVDPITDDFPEDAVVMESYKPGVSRDREIAWERTVHTETEAQSDFS